MQLEPHKNTQGVIRLVTGGRLGNQLFRYAFARALQVKYFPDYKLEVGFVTRRPITDEQKRFGLKNSLVDFKVENICANDMLFTDKSFTKLFTFPQKILYSFYRIARNILPKKLLHIINSKTFRKIYNHFGIYIAQPPSRFEPFTVSYGKNILCDSEFEAHEYFDDIRDILLREFTPKHDVLEHNRELMNDIESSESVCVTIRRGEFLTSNTLNVCNAEYFINAMKEIRREIPSSKFFVFSDDVEDVKRNIAFPFEVRYEGGKDPVWEKLRLMYSCKHFIISNSTFSWWAQYLGRNENKIVYAPAVWRLNDKCEGLDTPYMRKIKI